MVRALLLLALVACGDPPPRSSSRHVPLLFSAQHERALRASGLKDAKPAGYSPFVCAEGDSMFNSAGFEANGVKGMVCCGILKGCTVRFE